DNTQYAFAYKSDKDLEKSFRIFSAMRYPWLVKAGSALAPIALKLRLPINGLIRNTIFQQFCGGENLQEVDQTASYLNEYGVESALDDGVDRSEGEANYDQTITELKTAIAHAGAHPNIPMISLKVTGFARFGLLEKYPARETWTKEEKEEW